MRVKGIVSVGENAITFVRHLGRRHAWPAGDLVLRKAVRSFYGDIPDVRSFGARFHPFQNLAAHYLLTGLRLGI